MSKESIRKDAINAIIDCLENGYDGYWCDLHNEVFNTEYYVVGTSDAKERLTEYNVFDAIEKVVEYEKFNFGEIYTDITIPERLCNMLFYIVGEDVLFEMSEICREFNEWWNDKATEEQSKVIIDILKSML